MKELNLGQSLVQIVVLVLKNAGRLLRRKQKNRPRR